MKRVTAFLMKGSCEACLRRNLLSEAARRRVRSGNGTIAVPLSR
jgi:hypothetical protein